MIVTEHQAHATFLIEKRQPQPGMPIVLTINDPAGGKLTRQGCAQTEREHVCDGSAKCRQCMALYVTTEDTAQTGPDHTENHIPLRIDFDNGNIRKVRPKRARVYVMTIRQRFRCAPAFPILNNTALSRCKSAKSSFHRHQ